MVARQYFSGVRSDPRFLRRTAAAWSRTRSSPTLGRSPPSLTRTFGRGTLRHRPIPDRRDVARAALSSGSGRRLVRVAKRRSHGKTRMSIRTWGF